MSKEYEYARELAIAHLKSLPNDILPSLGLRYLIRFYQFICNSSSEEVITYKSAKCIITYHAESFWRRVIIRTFPSFIKTVLPKLLSKQFRDCLWLNKKHSSSSPQIAFMFSTGRGNGHGSELLKRCNLSPLYVKTLKGGHAEQFYKKNGFKECEIFEYAKRTYSILVRN